VCTSPLVKLYTKQKGDHIYDYIAMFLLLVMHSHGESILYCIVLYCIVLYCIVLYCIVLYCIVLYCIVLYCIVV
jgi:hypothetical protein